MWIPSWMFKGGGFRLSIYNPWILVPHNCNIQLECKIWWQTENLKENFSGNERFELLFHVLKLVKEFFSVHKEVWEEIGTGINFTVSLLCITIIRRSLSAET